MREGMPADLLVVDKYIRLNADDFGVASVGSRNSASGPSGTVT